MISTSLAARPTRRRLLRALAAAGGLGTVGGPVARATAEPGPPAGGPRGHMSTRAVEPDPDRAREIRAEFVHAWQGYKRHAWGHDELLPLSGGHQEFFARGRPVGLSIVEALDTLYVMGLDAEVEECVGWIEDRLDFDLDADFQVFEATIRLVGGLLAGYAATGARTLLELAADLADRMLPAFTRSPTGMPYRFVNLRTGRVSGAVLPVAEIGSNILEFGVLSELTGDARYRRAAKRALGAVVERRSSLDLIATAMNVETGEWTDREGIGVDPPVDSFYEYLWGAWEMFGDRDCRDWFRLFAASLERYQAERVDGRLWFRHVDFRTGEALGRRQSSLAVAILPVGGANSLAADYYRSWTAVLEKYEVIPELIDYGRLAALDRRNLLRPEYANCAFELYWQTGDPSYRRTAWQYFENLREHHRVDGGYAVVTDLTRRPMTKGDHCPAYVFAENFKWLYLLFSGTPRFDYRTGYLSTEGKVLRGLRRTRS
ncbi:glycoside hydrolase family 47 protein [Streptomyces sp. NPDC049555]|uniref:glycoside hydrolase family 47 protein n=1 Tax=unclassified Streptomyces TaxID=2593676 RepID=UPI00341A22CF